jgi:2-methylcitrate dehydratase PrpD
MPSPTAVLAEFAVGLSFDRLPDDIVRKASDSVLDTVGVSIFGAGLPWSRMIIDYAMLYGGGGSSTIMGTPHRVQAPLAALANGALAHGFEMDNLRQPSAGVHAGSTLVPGMFAIGEEVGASGRDALAAFVAACEVMARIGVAADNTAEKLGFHSPGLTGTFGSAIVAGRLLGLDTRQMINALGIAGSLCSGLLAFSKSGNGGMVKRLHAGRASEGGVLAARLAASGFEGPTTILEGKFGFFDAYTRQPKMDRLLAGLGTDWEIARLCIKCYPCHVTAHTPVRALEELKTEHRFSTDAVERIEVATSEKVLSHHDILEPQDIAGAQYSLPFCLGVALVRDPNDPRSFLADPHADPNIRAVARKVRLSLNPESLLPGGSLATRMKVVLKDGRSFEIARRDFKGTPSNPMGEAELDKKFLALSEALGAGESRRQLAALHRLPELSDIREVFGG